MCALIERMKTVLWAALLGSVASAAFAATPQPNEAPTTTPIKHVIIVLGENRTFDHIFGLYTARQGQSIRNLLSAGIVNRDGSPGPDFAKARQYRAQVRSIYDPAPVRKEPYAILPPAMTDGAPQAPSENSNPPFTSLAVAADLDRGIAPADLPLVLSGATNLPKRSLDGRIVNAASLPNGPYRLTPSLPYDAYSANPTHRFFQMWQQMDCSVRHASSANPSGCLNDLFPWVEVTIGAGSNGKPQPVGFDDSSTGEGSAAMGIYDMAEGDAPYLKELADGFASSDNYHQAVNGGTGANHIMLGTGSAIWYTDGKGHTKIPPADEIENPNPQAGTNNYYLQDGYSGGSYVACADRTQPGVAPILDYLQSLKPALRANCQPGRYYLVNNYDPGYLGDGTRATKNRFTVPASPLPTIGDVLLKHRVSFRYYGEGWNAYLKDPTSELYCNICNFLQYTPTIMEDAARRGEHIADIDAFYDDVANNALPAVSFVKPSGINDGHPASSKLDLFEAFTRKIVTAVQGNQALWSSTAIFITFDEGGGYWDSGYIQILDFFGDGTRVPLLAVSPYATGGRIVHSYTDHVSLLKFIERNWSLPKVTRNGRDNLPNPVARASDPYVPINGPAIGDLMDMFKF